MPQPKLPSAAVVARHYWIEGKTVEQIGKRYGVSAASVSGKLTRAGYPPRRRKLTGRCVLCDKRACRIKVWRRGKYRWEMSARCHAHELERKRAYSRDWYRRKRMSTHLYGTYNIRCESHRDWIQ